MLGPRSGQTRSLLKIEVGRKDMLPALCLGCGAPGTRGIELPALSPGKQSRSGYLCDACEEKRRAAATRAFASRMALTVLLVACAAVVLFAYEDSALLRQAWIVMLWGVGATALLEVWLARREPGRAFFESSRETGEGFLFVPDTEAGRKIARALEPRRTESVEHAPSRPLSLGSLVPTSAALGLFFLAHFSLDSELIILDAEGDSTILVDHRLRGRVESVSGESPTRLSSLRVFSGTRQVTWLGADGRIRFDDKVGIAPGQVVLLAAPPKGKCLFLESQSYGEAGPDHHLLELGPGPVHYLEPPPDHWLEPMPPPEPTATRGGQMTALRLLPCRSPRSRRAEL